MELLYNPENKATSIRMLVLKKTLLVMVLATLALSAVQWRYRIAPDPLLLGYARDAAPPDPKYFTWQRWFSLDFQQVFSNGVKDHTGFRNTLVRISHQFDYSFFGITHAPGFLQGKKRVFFEEDYIHEYTGRYFVGEPVIDRTLSRLKNVRDSLAAYNIPLIFVLESGKASIYPEYIPDRFHPDRRTLSNYEYFVRKSREIGLPLLDLNPYFRRLKDTVMFPVYPPYGMHWSNYATRMVADTLARYIEDASALPMPEFTVGKLYKSGLSLGSDYDIGDMLNLIWPLPETPGAMPLVSFGSLPDGNFPALVIGDSYYVGMIETYGKKMFGKQEFWYYNNSLYPHQNEVPPVRADKSGLREKLKSFRIVLVMVSEINLHNCLWNFADEAFLAFHPEVADPQLYRIENMVRIDREWFRFVVKKSVEGGIPLQQVIRDDAEYTFLSGYQNLEGKTFQDSIQFLRLSIRNNPDWMANVVRKAKEMNITPDSMMLVDAIYSYQQSKKNH